MNQSQRSNRPSFAQLVRMMHPEQFKPRCTMFNPLRSEIYGHTKHCRDCGFDEASHLNNQQPTTAQP